MTQRSTLFSHTAQARAFLARKAEQNSAAKGVTIVVISGDITSRCLCQTTWSTAAQLISRKLLNSVNSRKRFEKSVF